MRKNKNRSGSVSIQIIQKIGRRNKVIKTVGCAKTHQEDWKLVYIPFIDFLISFIQTSNKESRKSLLNIPESS